MSHTHLPISAFFGTDAVRVDGTFAQLDEVDTPFPDSLVYCQSLQFLVRANNNPNVSAIVTTPQLAGEPIQPGKAVIVVDDPRTAFFEVYMAVYGPSSTHNSAEGAIGTGCRIHPSAVICKGAHLGDRVEIGAGAVIDDSVTVMDDVCIGSNSVIGAEGLLTLRRPDGSLLRVRHAGGVSVGKGSMILAGAVVAKSVFQSPTRIGNYCQIGILSNVGHGASVGDQSVVSGNTVIAGRTRVGRGVWIGASVSIAQGLVIGDGAQVKMGAVVISDVAAKAVVSGHFALSHKTNMEQFLKLRS